MRCRPKTSVHQLQEKSKIEQSKMERCTKYDSLNELVQLRYSFTYAVKTLPFSGLGTEVFCGV